VLAVVVVSLALFKTVDRIFVFRAALRETKPEERVAILKELRMLYAEHSWTGRASGRPR
jgi:hypothetical protein